MERVKVNPELLRWALDRSGKSSGNDSKENSKKLPKKFPFDSWVNGKASPTLIKLKEFAEATYVPFGYFFLSDPPDEKLPIRDFRTIKNAPIVRQSGDLLDSIYTMQRRQDWLHEERKNEWGADALDFVGSVSLQDDPVMVGQKIRRAIGVSDGWAKEFSDWDSAVSHLRDSIAQLGVIVVINGVVGNNTHRKLDVDEFRGFALVDKYAPLIFVNGADAKSAQMFTLAHELAHIFLGQEGEGLTGDIITPGNNRSEKFCNQAAAEFLIPEQELRRQWRNKTEAFKLIKTAVQYFKVSPIAIGRQAMDIGLITRDEFFEFYEDHLRGEKRKRTKQAKGGGNFYNNLNVRIGKTFAAAVICAAMEGRLNFKEAYELTGLRDKTLRNYASHLGIYMRP